MAHHCSDCEANLASCPCTNLSCERRGHCCQCIAAHIAKDSLPACARHLSES